VSSPDEDWEIAELFGIEDEALAVLPDERPYEELAEFLRIAGATEERIWEALTDLADSRGDDWQEVFAVCFGDPSVFGPSEAL
jgi:hypothetical protein